MYGATTSEMDQLGTGNDDNVVKQQQRPLLQVSSKSQSVPALRRRRSSSKSTTNKRRHSTTTHKIAKKKEAEKPVLTKIFNESIPEEEPAATSQHHHEHSFVYTTLNPRSNQLSARIYKYFISAVIMIDLVFFIVGTEPNLPTSSQHVFKVNEGITSTIFLIEYMSRLCTITESHQYEKYGPILGRLKYMMTPSAIIDALATFPFFVERFSGWSLPQLTYLRVFRLLRIGKTQGYAKAMDAVYRVIYYNSEILHVALLVCIILVLVTSVLLYYLRPQFKHKPHPEFNSIPSTMYLSTLMLTGQGGPEGDLPWYTRMVVLMTSVFSVAMFAIPVSFVIYCVQNMHL